MVLDEMRRYLLYHSLQE